MSAIIINGKIVHYEVLGRGKPIIFLHGWVGSWRYWIPTMQTASIAYRAYAIDLWGFGETAKDTHRYSLERQTELLDAFMNEMGIQKVAFVGHGLGGVVALLYAAKQSLVVDRIMAVSLPLKSEELAERFGSTAPSDLAGRLLDSNSTAETARSEAAKADEEAIKISLKELKHLDLLDISKQLETASLLVHGLKDPLIDVPNLSINGDLPDIAHHIVFDRSGHFPMLDQPSKFNRLVNDFLDLESGESPQHLQLKEEWKRRVR
ncbi:MAG: alpha/beta hydrolase [Anaerolineales bacterium]|jgi:pimeloyl-ACP methyl ester carboxylesterase